MELTIMGLIDVKKYLSEYENFTPERIREIIAGDSRKAGTPVKEGDYSSLLEYIKRGGALHICVDYIFVMEYQKARDFFEKMLAAFNIGNIDIDSELQRIRENRKLRLARITDWRFSKITALNGVIGGGDTGFGEFDGWGQKHTDYTLNTAFNRRGLLIWTGNNSPRWFGIAGNSVFGISYKNRWLVIRCSIPHGIDIVNDIPGLDKIVMENFNKDFVEKIDLSDYFEGGFFNLNYEWRKQGFDYDKATEIRSMELRDSLLKIDLENVTYADKPYKGSFVYDLERKTVRRNHAG
jgi:hypothetical protein